ncbi:MAG: flavodoxin [Phycisphaerae bacterium]|jgi:flavodoxin long chain
MKVGLFYGSTTGNTARAAQLIRGALGPMIAICRDIRDATPAEFASCDGLILGVSTWEEGQMQEHFRDFLPELEKLDLRGKTVALFGLGDQQGYSGRFQDALGTLYEAVRRCGATVVGHWPAEGYRWATSTAVVDDQFVGLALDDDTQRELTPERIAQWVAQIRPFFEG